MYGLILVFDLRPGRRDHGRARKPLRDSNVCSAGSVNHSTASGASGKSVFCKITGSSAVLTKCAECGYKALFLSVDVPVLGHRLNEYRNDFRIPADMSYPNILSSGSDMSSRTDYGMCPDMNLTASKSDAIRSDTWLGHSSSLASKAYIHEDLVERK